MNKKKILDIVNREVKDFNLTLYDYHQESHQTMNQKNYYKNLKKRYERNKLKRNAEWKKSLTKIDDP